MRDPRYYCVYIMGSLTGTLYIGVSGNLHKRVFQHKFHHYEGFTNRYERGTAALLGIIRRCAQGAGSREATQGMGSGQESRAAGTAQSGVEGLGFGLVPVDGDG